MGFELWVVTWRCDFLNKLNLFASIFFTEYICFLCAGPLRRQLDAEGTRGKSFVFPPSNSWVKWQLVEERMLKFLALKFKNQSINEVKPYEPQVKCGHKIQCSVLTRSSFVLAYCQLKPMHFKRGISLQLVFVSIFLFWFSCFYKKNLT